MFDSAISIPLRTMIETSLSGHAYRGNEREEATRVKDEAKWQVRGRRVGSIDRIAVCVDKNMVSERTYQLERGGGGRSHGSDPGRQRLTCEIQGTCPSLEVDGHRFRKRRHARVIVYIGKVMTHRSGERIATGTPAGVGSGKCHATICALGRPYDLVRGFGFQQQRTVPSIRQREPGHEPIGS